jgi:hypothetical protein
MWWNWLPWRYVVRDVARKQGFLDPLRVFAQLQKFMQPSEVTAPTELLRSGVVLHARGLMNSLAIQHNLDWIWPYWVECQYDPRNVAFIPRSFSLTQINLTHRNWTALGIPNGTEFPLVDPRGLVTPYYDSWSIDVWIIPDEGVPLIPSRNQNVSQKMVMNENLCVITDSCIDSLTGGKGLLTLQLKADVIGSAESLLCRIRITGFAAISARLIVSLRPYNPEGVSFIHTIAMHGDFPGWIVNGEQSVCFDTRPDFDVFSDYHCGDVYSSLGEAVNPTCAQEKNESRKREVSCKVGMASAAAIYALSAGESRDISVSVPLMERDSYFCSSIRSSTVKMDYGAKEKTSIRVLHEEGEKVAHQEWEKNLRDSCTLTIPDKNFQFLYEAAVRTMVLHSPKEVYPGPYIYRRFWFRDAAFILHALLSVGLKDRVRRALDCFRTRQTAHGYFLSQEGEWDSNGEALWIMRQYCEMTNTLPPKEWKDSIHKAGKWICKKKVSSRVPYDHAGLLPSGFSAEHLGPNDFYYWDDFWAISGLKAAAFLSTAYREYDTAAYFESESDALLESVNRSLKKVAERLRRAAMPASPYRRMDSGAIGSLVAGYPLRIYPKNDPRLLDTVDFLTKKCLFKNGFFHDMTHSGINPYLTLHIAQVLLRAGDKRYFDLMTEVAHLASSTGQWPEAIHPRTGGGCMGDGQHVWAAAEWVLMIRNCFVREEDDGLILCSGIPRIWINKSLPIIFGPAPTRFGDIRVTVQQKMNRIVVEWHGKWFGKEPSIDIHVPGFIHKRVALGSTTLELEERAQI